MTIFSGLLSDCVASPYKGWLTRVSRARFDLRYPGIGTELYLPSIRRPSSVAPQFFMGFEAHRPTRALLTAAVAKTFEPLPRRDQLLSVPRVMCFIANLRY